MKKLILMVVILVVISGGIFCYFKLNDNKKEEDNIIDEPTNELPIEEKYVDDNPMDLGLYMVSENMTLKLVNEYASVWQLNRDITVFTVVASNDSIVPDGLLFQSSWLNYWNSYENADNYKIGYNFKFTLEDGTVIDKNILSPGGIYEVFPYVQVYLYDDINIAPGAWHSHLTINDVTERTKYTSIKLTCVEATKKFQTPIELTVFTYKNNDDFDPDTGSYRGNSFYKVTIYDKK